MNQHSGSIVLIGMMGAGKSAVGRCLQQRFGFSQFDTDQMVASKFGMPVPEIFSTHGEHAFRDAETEMLQALAPSGPAVIVTGGGIVLREKNLDLLKRLGAVVWLQADEATLFKRASRTGNRPLLQHENPRNAFAQMLQARLPLYAKIADIRVDTSALTGQEVALAILSKFKRYCRQ
ncbi:MAG TPA: shikimate kinase [Candidatus Udaeobacter sp.]|nr:shikimate kinase [Candidatus Udaeobacter sp.]